MANDTIPLLQVPIVQRTVTVTSGNLFQVASQYLGSAEQWTRIAQINQTTGETSHMVDPFFTGLKVLRIPSVNANAGTDGILYA